MKPESDITLYNPDNELHAVTIAMRQFGAKVTQRYEPAMSANFLGQGYCWCLALDREKRILAAMAIREQWPLGLVTILVFEQPQPAERVHASFLSRGVEGFWQAINQGRPVDDPALYPHLLGPFRFLTGQMAACAEQQARGHGNN